MSAKKPRKRGHRYVRVQIELTEKQRLWLHEVDQECQIGVSSHIRFAVLQYRARVNQHRLN